VLRTEEPLDQDRNARKRGYLDGARRQCMRRYVESGSIRRSKPLITPRAEDVNLENLLSS
jgi:hypothetical protein